MNDAEHLLDVVDHKPYDMPAEPEAGEPAPEAPMPEAPTPDTAVPEQPAPEQPAPDVVAPDVVTPETPAPETGTPEAPVEPEGGEPENVEPEAVEPESTPEPENIDTDGDGVVDSEDCFPEDRDRSWRILESFNAEAIADFDDASGRATMTNTPDGVEVEIAMSNFIVTLTSEDRQPVLLTSPPLDLDLEEVYASAEFDVLNADNRQPSINGIAFHQDDDFYRYCALEGYSMNTLGGVFDNDEPIATYTNDAFAYINNRFTVSAHVESNANGQSVRCDLRGYPDMTIDVVRSDVLSGGLSLILRAPLVLVRSLRVCAP